MHAAGNSMSPRHPCAAQSLLPAPSYCFQVLASLAAIATELIPGSVPRLSLHGYVPCLGASAWVAESMALGLVALTTSVHVFMARREDYETYAGRNLL